MGRVMSIPIGRTLNGIHEYVLLGHLQMWRSLHSYTPPCYIFISKEEEGKQHKADEKRHLLAQKAFHLPFAASEVETSAMCVIFRRLRGPWVLLWHSNAFLLNSYSSWGVDELPVSCKKAFEPTLSQGASPSVLSGELWVTHAICDLENLKGLWPWPEHFPCDNYSKDLHTNFNPAMPVNCLNFNVAEASIWG